MKLRTWPFLLIGFGALMALIGGSAIALHGSLGKVYGEVAGIQETLRGERDLIDRIRSELFLTAILVRDYLLESSLDAAVSDRTTLESLRSSIETNLAALEMTGSVQQREQVIQLRKAITTYWLSLDPIFEWTQKEKAELGRAFLRRAVVPYREAVLSAIGRLGELNAQQGLQRQEQVLQTEQELKFDLRRIAGLALFLGAVVAVASILRTRSLEAATTAYLLEIENSARELRRLSQNLSGAQEDERRRISRELHDQIGQMLTALRMELGNVEDFRDTQDDDFVDHLNQAKRLTEDTLRSVRNLSTGLRPSVLDELGLAPALHWQAREFTKRAGVPVDVTIDGELTHLPDTHRTCIYRIVQEALTNAARHAKAKSIRIILHGAPQVLSLTVEDDGVGFDVQSDRERGIGLLGIEERVRELGGMVDLRSRHSAGTSLHCEIPRPKERNSEN
ncbi:MAG: histidine kinase [Candidatus Solibacter sp.]